MVYIIAAILTHHYTSWQIILVPLLDPTYVKEMVSTSLKDTSF